jgi:hypothetical protein
MIEAIAPVPVPLAPRPLPSKLFSCCLLRVAGANYVYVNDLLRGFHSRYPAVPYPQCFGLG